VPGESNSKGTLWAHVLGRREPVHIDAPVITVLAGLLVVAVSGPGYHGPTRACATRDTNPTCPVGRQSFVAAEYPEQLPFRVPTLPIRTDAHAAVMCYAGDPASTWVGPG
jgi:hypothetical protein